MWKTQKKEINIKKRTRIFTLRQFSVSACANQPPGFSVSETSTSNGLFKTINELEASINRLLKTAPLAETLWIIPFGNWKSWTFGWLLKLAISYFSDIWKFHDLGLHKRKIYPTLQSFSVFLFLPVLDLLKRISWYICGYKLSMKFPPDFHNYTRLKRLVNSFSWFNIAPPNKLIWG